ncbi:chemotaxis protein CheB [Fervidobacterium gondwanense]|uniref:protein-glutamate methylesterase n=1 Tax=Fervidobacterium gondwanense DSM 13020 TaxID=1121883 RepID=A0A1M7TE52_FERGO|nr:chemotaxis protein CheB [Fervidobacterium gondwanense]SHN68938.1 two-component system, chemotaxis family, response regulator CheB [Fervidobacterium gondwanense DSM 13020]
MRKFIIVGSAGSPSQAVEILKIEERLNVPVIICIHFTASVMETFAEHLRNDTGHKVEIVTKPTRIEDKIYLPEGNKDIVFISENIITVMDSEKTGTSVHPSISALFKSLIRYGDSETVIAVLGGLGDDGARETSELKKRGVRFIIEKLPRFPYLPDNIAQNLGERYEKFEIEKIRSVLKELNKAY